mgnify:CR=1 FL=1
MMNAALRAGICRRASLGSDALAVDRQHPVAGPLGALRASQIAPGDLVGAQLCRLATPASECSVPTVRRRIRLG